MNDGKKYAEGTPSEIFALGDKLIEFGLELPFAMRMTKLFQSKGVQLAGQHMTEEELVNDHGHQTSTSKLCLFNGDTF